MDLQHEKFLSLARVHLKLTEPDIYERIKDKHRLWPLIITVGRGDQSAYTELLLAEKKEARDLHLEIFMQGAALHLALEPEDNGFEFMHEIMGYMLTPMGQQIAMITHRVRSNSKLHIAWVRFCTSLKREGFLDCFHQWISRDTEETIDSRLGLNLLMDPAGYNEGVVYDLLAEEVFKSGNYPTRDELAKFCRDWVKAEDASNRKQQRKQQKKDGNIPDRDCPKILDAYWISHALWCLDTVSILELFPHFERGTKESDHEKAVSKINQAISQLGFKRFPQHQTHIDAAVDNHREIMANLVKR